MAALAGIFEDSTPLSPSLLQLEFALSRLSYNKIFNFNSLRMAALVVIYQNWLPFGLFSRDLNDVHIILIPSVLL
jgi:hypothetical protein